MATINDIMIAALPLKRKLREAYIDLKGMDAIWRKIPDDVNRRDFYGDIIQTGFIPELVPMKIVMDTKELYALQDNFIAGNTENAANFALKHYTGMVKYHLDIKKGDLIDIVFTKGSDIAQADIRPFRVVDVNSKAYNEPICKTVILSPYQ